MVKLDQWNGIILIIFFYADPPPPKKNRIEEDALAVSSERLRTLAIDSSPSLVATDNSTDNFEIIFQNISALLIDFLLAMGSSSWNVGPFFF